MNADKHGWGLVRAVDVGGIPRAFRPDPLRADEMEHFYSNSLDKRRGNYLNRTIKDALVESADQRALFFQGILYGNRGVGKSTEINRLLDNVDIKSRFVVIRLDALNDLNPQSFSVADVLLLLLVKLIERCEEKCRELGRAFSDSQSNEQLTRTTGEAEG